MLKRAHMGAQMRPRAMECSGTVARTEIPRPRRCFAPPLKRCQRILPGIRDMYIRPFLFRATEENVGLVSDDKTIAREELRRGKFCWAHGAFISEWPTTLGPLHQLLGGCCKPFLIFSGARVGVAGTFSPNGRGANPLVHETGQLGASPRLARKAARTSATTANTTKMLQGIPAS